MTRVLIAEDEALLAAEIREELLRQWPEAQIVGLARDGHEALRLVEQLSPQVCFLDVQMPGLSGLEVAQLIGRRAHVVFITAHERYAVQAFDEGAVGYLLKPLDPVRMARTLQRLKERLPQQPADLGGLAAHGPPAVEPLRWITVQRGRELQLITVEDVAYFRADHKYVAVVTADSEALISLPLKELVQRLDGEHFWQVHRSTIVNARAIKSVTRTLSGKLGITLKDRPETLEVSPSYAHRFKQL
ncbi:LytTR family DNA-binding domain-containing protein [Roseateles asaccharophilus]|uniref:DNA-binding LytR/AlgR family response regulator n=1 Tax=Roseateles asaccharophilus TaxID=582607 RepID=A0ABU2A1C5_9BURK|nr:LytTR family DNA-binding domain-containing protein [Roseateles asaccharophilus]MDR7330996.1 DNA-binding LytR/AlgR family response regulator [Roseateles asaccharophilus]